MIGCVAVVQVLELFSLLSSPRSSTSSPAPTVALIPHSVFRTVQCAMRIYCCRFPIPHSSSPIPYFLFPILYCAMGKRIAQWGIGHGEYALRIAQYGIRSREWGIGNREWKMGGWVLGCPKNPQEAWEFLRRATNGSHLGYLLPESHLRVRQATQKSLLNTEPKLHNGPYLLEIFVHFVLVWVRATELADKMRVADEVFHLLDDLRILGAQLSKGFKID